MGKEGVKVEYIKELSGSVAALQEALAHFIFIINHQCEAAGKMGVLPYVYRRLYYGTKLFPLYLVRRSFSIQLGALYLKKTKQTEPPKILVKL